MRLMLFFLCHHSYLLLFFFFFQAEDGIRDVAVTGVQTCALPISTIAGSPLHTPITPLHYALTSATPSAPTKSRSAASRSSAASTRNARLRRRTVLPFSSLSLLPFSPCPRSPRHSMNSGVGPGCAAHNAAIARVVSGW